MAARILVVDDELPVERLICQQFRKQIRTKELEFVFAHNGIEALNKLREDQQIDMILTDINMPEMDGLTLLEKLKELELNVKAVVVTAYSDMENIRKAMNHDAFDFLMKPINFEDLEVTINRTLETVRHIKETQQQLQQIQTQLVQKEKMSALGQLVAGVAHEINNPINFVVGNLTHAQEYIHSMLHLLELYQQHYPEPAPEIAQEIEAIELDYLMEDLPQLVSSMKVGIDRMHQLSIALRSFSRSDTSKKLPVDLHEGLESTLLILRHRLKGSGTHPAINVVKDYGDLPLVSCYPAPLNQVFMNLLANAIDAIDESVHQGIVIQPPTIKISTRMIEENRVEIRIVDNGQGMSETVKNNLFQPMFTTKPVGKGTGLGLSICNQIICEKHQGSLTYHSEVGEGTEFIIQIPVKGTEERPDHPLFSEMPHSLN
jgi:two-component system NtrC family sensor kinase